MIIKVSLAKTKTENRNFGVNLTSKLSLAVTRSRSNWFRRGSKINETYRTHGYFKNSSLIFTINYFNLESVG